MAIQLHFREMQLPLLLLLITLRPASPLARPLLPTSTSSRQLPDLSRRQLLHCVRAALLAGCTSVSAILMPQMGLLCDSRYAPR